MSSNVPNNGSMMLSPALMAYINGAGASRPVTPVTQSRPITTASYLVQEPVVQQGVSSAVLEKTPTTDVYEPMHTRHDENGGKKGHKGAKVAIAAVSIAAIIAAVLFAPKLAEKLLKDVDSKQPLIKGKGMFGKENVKVALKKFAEHVKNFEDQILQDSKKDGFLKTEFDKVRDAFKEGGVINKNFKKVTDAFKEGGAVREFVAGIFSKKGAGEEAADTAVRLMENA